MSQRSSGRSLVGLILEIAVIAAIVAILPKANLKPQPADSPPSANSPWWQAASGAQETSWQEPAVGTEKINVEQTLNRASRRLLDTASDYAGRAAADLLPPRPAAEPIQAQPRDWPRY